jgi:oligopeptide/dipeptide ABC transporter ATP-binding protein
VRGLDLTLQPGTCLAVVGESGSGKSSLARALTGLTRDASGDVHLRTPDGSAFSFLDATAREQRSRRGLLQIVFQDPMNSFNPRLSIGESVAEPMRNLLSLPKAKCQERVLALLDAVGLKSATYASYPHELSGGQRQRAGIARGLACSPRVLILDEAVSALDTSLRAQVLNVLKMKKEEEGLAMIFITHDFSVVRSLADRVLVMYQGRAVEEGTRAQVMENPQHPYTRCLIHALPIPDPRLERERIRLAPPPFKRDPLATLSGCAYYDRCEEADEACTLSVPSLPEGDHGAACHHRGEPHLPHDDLRK